MLMALGLLFTVHVLLITTHADIQDMLRRRSAGEPRPLPHTCVPMRTSRSSPAGGCSPVIDSVIRDDFLCNDDETSGCEQRSPEIAVDPTGRFVVCWYEFRDGDADIWLQRFDAGGTPVGRNIRINTDITFGWQGDPAAAMAADGSFMFSWEDRRDIGNSDVFGQRFDASGNRLGDNFRISDSAAAGDQDMSSCSFAPDRSALVVWDDRRNGLTGDIFGQFLDPNGNPRGGNFRVNDDAVGQANQYEPDVGCDSLGRYVVVWMDGRGLNAYDWNIFGQRFDINGNRLGSNFQVTVDESIQWVPRVGVAPTGRFMVCWDDRRRGQYDVYAQLFVENGQPQGSNFRVNNDAGVADQSGGDVAANRFGEYLVVWTDRREGNADIYCQRFLPDGSPIGSNMKVNDDVGTTNQLAPTVAAAADGGYWVGWIDERSGNPDIYCRRLDRNGSAVSPSFRVNDDTGSAHQRVSSIAMERGGQIYIAWEDERNGSTDAYGCLLDAAGNQQGPNRRLNDDGQGGAGQYYCAVGAGKGKFVVTWTDDRAGLDIYGQFIDSSGQPVGQNFRVNSDTGNAFQWYSFSSMDTLNRSIVVWMDTRNGPFQIFGRLFDAAGVPTGPDFCVQDVLTYGYYASVARNETGRFVCAWMDYREDNEPNIYCQVFREDGSRVGSNFRVNDDRGRNYQGYPACAIASDGTFVVAWEDTRNGDCDVYLQWFDSTGTALAENQRVNDDQTTTDCYSPSCVFSPDHCLAVMFNDERETAGNPQVYCQVFRPDRTRNGLNRKVNNANLFPKNHHWTVGQSVAASSGTLAFAWTENRRHRGWDIFAKLTDWEIVGLCESSSGLPPVVCAGTLMVRRGSRVSFPGGRGVHVYDHLGRQILFQRGESTVVDFDLQELGAGVYFVMDNDRTLRVRLLVY